MAGKEPLSLGLWASILGVFFWKKKGEGNKFFQGRFLLATSQGSSSSIPSNIWVFSSPHKAVFRNFLSAIRTHPIRASGDSSSMFFVFGFDLIFKVFFVCIGLALAFLGFSWRCSWSFFVVTPYLSLSVCHLPKRHMMSTYVWASSAFIITYIEWYWFFTGTSSI